ncbi:MAG: DUF2147 domain-containing protein [Sphingomonadales bacterium]|nr:DUF2147 domain-containing protein [Sphingomonadales bacterium]
MRRQPVCGMQVIGDLKRMGGGRWDQGWIYDPKEGKSYDVAARSLGLDDLVPLDRQINVVAHAAAEGAGGILNDFELMAILGGRGSRRAV